MKIYYFTLDPISGCYFAGVKTPDGKRRVLMICHQYGYYVKTGSKRYGDLTFHHFTEEQTQAYEDFKSSGWDNLEFFANPI